MNFPCFVLFFFSIFDIARLRKIRQIHWKQRLEIIKIAKFESYFLKTYPYEDIAPQSRQLILQSFVWWGEGTNLSPTISLSLAILLLLRHSFQWVDGFSLTGLSVSKVEKTVEWPIVTSLLQP